MSTGQSWKGSKLRCPGGLGAININLENLVAALSRSRRRSRRSKRRSRRRSRRSRRRVSIFFHHHGHSP